MKKHVLNETLVNSANVQIKLHEKNVTDNVYTTAYTTETIKLKIQ